MLAELGLIDTTAAPQTTAKEIPLQNGLVALVSPEDYDRLKNYNWFAKLYHGSYYAVRKVKFEGRYRLVKMHRMAAHTPIGMITHHRNKNTLDNRRCNLLNLFPKLHTAIHRNDRILVKFAEP